MCALGKDSDQPSLPYVHEQALGPKLSREDWLYIILADGQADLSLPWHTHQIVRVVMLVLFAGME